GSRLERLAAIVLQRGMLAPQFQERLVPAERRASGRAFAVRAIDAAAQERLLELRIRHLFLEAAERLELLAPALAHRLPQRGIAVADEVLERLGRGPFLALEEERQRRRERRQRRRCAQPTRRGQRGEPLAPGPVADLVVVLRADDESTPGQVTARSPVLATAMLGMRPGVVPAVA